MGVFRRKRHGGGSGSSEPPAARDRSDAVRFFFYFDNEGSARTAEADLTGKGYSVKLTAPDEAIPQWSVIASGTPDTIDVSSADDLMEPWAATLGGEFDGHEIALG